LEGTKKIAPAQKDVWNFPLWRGKEEYRRGRKSPATAPKRKADNGLRADIFSESTAKSEKSYH